jgi:hypothetical protein
MKKLLSIIALLMAFAAAGFAADKTVYLKPTADWLSGARFAVHMFGSSDGETSWADVNTLATNETDIYKVVIPEKFTKIIFCRMNGATTENNWGNRWNQTQDITLTSDKDLYTITGWDTCDEGSTYTLATISSVSLTGDLDLALADGEEKVLDLSSTLLNKNFKLKVNNTEIGTNQLTLVDAGGLVTLGTNDGDNFTLKNNTSGYKTYTVKAKWAPSSNAAKNWTLTIAGQDARVLNYAIVGDWTTDGEGWDNDQPMTKDSENPSIYTLTINDFPVAFEAGQTKKTYYYKLRTNGIWGLYDLPNGNENKSKEFTEEGTYTLVFTANVSEHTLDMTATKKFILPGTTIYTSSTPTTVDWGSPITISYATLTEANAKIGDRIHVRVDGVTEGAQVRAQSNWTALESGIGVNGESQEVSFILTGDMMTRIKANGLQICGTGYSTSQVTLETTSYSGSEKSIWIGNAESNFGIDWMHFANANVKAGDVLRVTATKHESSSSGYWLELAPGGNWGENLIRSDANDEIHYYFITLTTKSIEQVTKEWSSSTINHGGYTITQVELVPMTGYYVVNNENTWTTVAEMTKDEGEYTTVLKNMADKYFVIFPNNALSDEATAIHNWNKAIRPTVESGNFNVNYWINYQSTTTNTNNGAVWHVADNNTADLTLTFKPDLSENNYTITASETIVISDAGYRTYSKAQNYKVADGTSVYYVKEVGESIKLTAAESNILPGTGTENKAGRGIILKGKGKVVITPTDPEVELAALEDNMLVGTGDWDYDLSGYDNDYTCFILAIGDNGVGFYNATGTVGAHKAFLPILTSTLSTTAREFLGFEEGNTTSIDVRSKMEDGRGDVYNLNGQRVAQPTKGLYIVNGRKVVIK